MQHAVARNDKGKFGPFIRADEEGVADACLDGSGFLHLGALEKGDDLRQDEEEDAEYGEDDAEPAHEDEAGHEGVNPQGAPGNAKPLRVRDPQAIS